MKLRPVIVYAVLALAAAALYFFDRSRRGAEGEAERQARLVFDTAVEDIDRLTIKRPGETILIAKEACPGKKGCWRILEPVATAADTAAVERVAADLTGLMALRTFKDEKEDLSAFGLDRPDLSILYETGSGFSSGITFGEMSPVREGYYARRTGSREIMLVPRDMREKLDKTLFDVRDRRLFHFDPREVVEADIDGPEVSWRFSRSGDQWRLRDDPDFIPDGRRVDTIVGRFIWAEAASFEGSDLFDAAAFGLDSPRYRVRLSDGRRAETLLVGNPVGGDEGRFYGCMLEGTEIFTVHDWVVAHLPAGKEELRVDSD
ncbi:DUF4340 domain-containing protein [Desulfatiglans anilini]|uniref:DUF4340 domain-containing protein n=1 Tax=Desulfatiglans anilini TaxID=90728 RepID=UPI00041AB95F|nr:DUF4340 domain-containing protein [Desulfatiglans anilini]